MMPWRHLRKLFALLSLMEDRRSSEHCLNARLRCLRTHCSLISWTSTEIERISGALSKKVCGKELTDLFHFLEDLMDFVKMLQTSSKYQKVFKDRSKMLPDLAGRVVFGSVVFGLLGALVRRAFREVCLCLFGSVGFGLLGALARRVFRCCRALCSARCHDASEVGCVHLRRRRRKGKQMLHPSAG